MENNLPILITGSGGFIGKNLVERLKNLGYNNLMLYDVNSTKDELRECALKARLVYHLAGVNRPKDASEFYEGNSGLTELLINLLCENKQKPGIIITSSAQAALDNDYGRSKKLSEDAVRAYRNKTGAAAYIYRLPGVFGKWCRPAYNSVVATFCNNIANNKPIEVRDESYTFPLVYIDDVVKSFTNILTEQTADGECTIKPEYSISLGELAATISGFKESRLSLLVPNMGNELCKKLYATYLSYLPKNEFAYDIKMNCDERGSFTEFLHMNGAGQVSINISKPGIVKGNHWHDTKNEKFLVVHGEGIIRFRQIHSEDIIEYRVNGKKMTVVDIPTGYTHNIENVGEGDMVTVMWANEPFDKENPDTYFLKV